MFYVKPLLRTIISLVGHKSETVLSYFDLDEQYKL